LLALAAAILLAGAASAQDGAAPAQDGAAPAQDGAAPAGDRRDSPLVSRADLDRTLGSLRTEFNAHFDAIEKAVDLAHQDSVRVPTIVDRAIAAEDALLQAKIAIAEGISSVRLEEISGRLGKLDIQFQERTAASSTAIAAALQAAKEAVGQQNQSSGNAIDKAQQLSSSEIAAAASQIGDLKGRLDKAEGPLLLSQASVAAIEAQLVDVKSRIDQNAGHSGGATDTYFWIFALIGAGGVVVGIIAVLRNHQPPRGYL
jgi:hypothetical protein